MTNHRKFLSKPGVFAFKIGLFEGKNGWDVSHHQKGRKMGRMKGLLGALVLLLMFVATAWALDCQSLGLRVAEVSLDAPIKDVVWLEGKVVFVLTHARTLYRSSDDGRTFSNVMEMLEDSLTPPEEAPFKTGVSAMYPSDADPKRLFFEGASMTHWVTYDRGSSFIKRNIEKPLTGIKMHKTNADLMLASHMSQGCYMPASRGTSECSTSLQVSYDYGHSFVQAVRSVAQYDWGPGENTVIYSAYDDLDVSAVQRMGKGLGVYRSSDAFRKSSNTYLVVEKGAGFKVSKSGIYVATYEAGGTMQLHVSRDDGRSFLPAVFPSKLQETRYTVMDQDDGTVFVSVEHQKPFDASTSPAQGGITVGDLYASVADGELLFKDDFEAGLTKWRGRHGSNVPARGRIVSDPLCDKDGEGCRGKVLKMEGCSTEGDAFSLHSFTCSLAFPCKVSMWVLGSPWQGFSDGFPGNHIWTAAGDADEKGLHKKVPVTDGKWSRVEYVFPRQQSEFVWQEGASKAGSGQKISRVRVMVEAKDEGHCHDTYFDDIRVTRARSEDYVMALRGNTRDMLGHVDVHAVGGLEGTLIANIRSDSSDDSVTTVYSKDNGNEWHPLPPPLDSPEGCVPPRGKQGEWRTRSGHRCGLHLHGQHKIKGVPGKWEFRAHKEVDREWGPLLSTPAAVGLMLGVGNVGERLKHSDAELNTYVSRDAGETWSRVADGSHTYDVADQGGLVLAARNVGVTQQLMFSIDGGVSFKQCSFTGGKDLEVSDVVADPASSSSNFLVYGSTKEADGGSLFSLDLSSLFDRTCTDQAMAGDPGSDYEVWRPHAVKGKEIGCEMGRQVDFVRRKPTSRCLIGDKKLRGTLERDCRCTEADYECDFCYERVGEAEAAAKNLSVGACSYTCSGQEHTVPEDCFGTYLRSRGYRLIEGDTCQGGVELGPRRFECPRKANTGGFFNGGGQTGEGGGGGGWIQAGLEWFSSLTRGIEKWLGLAVGGVVAAGVLIKVVSLLRRFCAGGSTGLAGRRPVGGGGWGGGAVRGLLGVPGWMTSWMKSSRYYSYSQLSTSEMLLEEDDDDNDDFAMADRLEAGGLGGGGSLLDDDDVGEEGGLLGDLVDDLPPRPPVPPPKELLS